MNLIHLFPDHDQVHVWAVWLRAPDAVSRAYRVLLSPEEVAQADQFAFEHLKRSYELSQGALRLLLARYLKGRPRDMAFTFGPRRKPALLGGSRIRFNMSHSGDLALYAFTADCEIGVDVEQVRAMSDIEQIASHYFCRAEALELSSIRGSGPKQEAFYRCWTRKEAYIKAVGDGLHIPLDRFQVTLLPDDPPRFLHIQNDARAAAEWTLQHLDPAPGYVGALAYHGGPLDIELRQPLEAWELLEGIG